MPASAINPEELIPSEGQQDQQEIKVSLSDFLNQQRAVISSELMEHGRSLAFQQEQVALKKAILTMIDHHLAELAQPVEPGQEVQS